MTKTSILLLAGTALAGVAAVLIARRRKNMPEAAMQETVKKTRHLNPVFSKMKQDTQHS
jgi:LPXTG-motif cell wall-anchored protein